jgi:hypothetical protein
MFDSWCSLTGVFWCAAGRESSDFTAGSRESTLEPRTSAGSVKISARAPERQARLRSVEVLMSVFCSEFPFGFGWSNGSSGLEPKGLGIDSPGASFYPFCPGPSSFDKAPCTLAKAIAMVDFFNSFFCH